MALLADLAPVHLESKTGIKITVIKIETTKGRKKTEISKIVNRRKSFGVAVKLVIPLRSRDGLFGCVAKRE